MCVSLWIADQNYCHNSEIRPPANKHTLKTHVFADAVALLHQWCEKKLVHNSFVINMGLNQFPSAFCNQIFLFAINWLKNYHTMFCELLVSKILNEVVYFRTFRHRWSVTRYFTYLKPEWQLRLRSWNKLLIMIWELQSWGNNNIYCLTQFCR